MELWFRSVHKIRSLEQIIEFCRKPKVLRCDNDPEELATRRCHGRAGAARRRLLSAHPAQLGKEGRLGQVILLHGPLRQANPHPAELHRARQGQSYALAIDLQLPAPQHYAKRITQIRKLALVT